MERWRRVRASRRAVRTDAPDDEKQLLVDAARMMRETHKEGKIRSFLESFITTKEVVHASFGQVCYFQYLLHNPFAEDRVIQISFKDPELQLVTDANEWRSLNNTWGYPGRVEENMLADDGRGGYSIWLQGHQEVKVPFKFVTLNPGDVPLDSDTVGGSVAARPPATAHGTLRRSIEVSFEAKRPVGAPDPLYVLLVEVHPQPIVVDQSFRFYHGHSDFLKKRVLVDPCAAKPGGGWRSPPGSAGLGGGIGRQPKHAWCSDSSVIVGSTPYTGDAGGEEVHIKYRVGAAGTRQSFYIVVYDDITCSSVFEIWHVTIHAVNRIDLQGLVGQTEREGCSLTLRSKDGPKEVNATSSHPRDLCVDREGAFQIGTALTEVPMKYTPMQPGRKDVLVHFTESRTDGGLATPLSSWLIVTRAKMPVINKRYDISIKPGKASSKKIMYTNPYSIDRTFKLRTDKPTLLSFRDKTELVVGPKGTHYISLKFNAVFQKRTEDILVFVNDEEDKNEECLCISVTYA